MDKELLEIANINPIKIGDNGIATQQKSIVNSLGKEHTRRLLDKLENDIEKCLSNYKNCHNTKETRNSILNNVVNIFKKISPEIKIDVEPIEDNENEVRVSVSADDVVTIEKLKNFIGDYARIED